MKNFLIPILIAVSFSCSAQQNNQIIIPVPSDSIPKDTTKPSEKKLFRPNDLKINLAALFVRNYSISYERSIARKISVQVGYRYQPYIYLFDNFSGKKVSEQGSIDSNYINIKTSNNAYTVGIRFYTGKNPGTQGIFFGLYGTYASFAIDNSEYSFIKDDGNSYKVPFVSTSKLLGGGISLGQKWIIKKRISFEIYSGIQYGKLSGPLTSNKNLSELSEQDKLNLKEDIEGLFTINSKKYLNATVSDDGIDGKIKGPSYGLRYGFSLGFVF